MSTSRTPSIDHLLAQGLRERARGGSDDLLEQILRDAAVTQQGNAFAWDHLRPRSLGPIALTVLLLIGLAGALTIGLGLIRRPMPPMPQYHHNGVLLVAQKFIYQVVDIGGADAATRIVSPEIVAPGHHYVTDVSWAPDGSRLAFAVSDGVYVASVSDGIPTQICACPHFSDVAYSPHGSTIAVTRGAALILFSLESAGSRALVTRGDSLSSPSWSPDGRRLAFVSTGGGSSTLWVVGDDGSKPVPLAAAAPNGHEIFDAAWSPDGKTIAYILTSNVTDWQASGYTLTLESIRPDGSDQTMLADAGACYCVGYPRSGLTWSPDGSRIALGVPGEGTYLLNPDGTNRHGVASQWEAPAWRPVP